MLFSLRILVPHPGKKRSSLRSHPARSRLLLESLEDRNLPSISFSGPGNTGAVTVTGTQGQDQFLIRLKPGDNTTIEFSDNGGAKFTDASLAKITSITVNGLGGRDTLTLDESNGLVATAAGLPITFDGGPGKDTLHVLGNPKTMVTEVFTMGTATQPAMLTISATTPTASSNVSLIDVEAIVDTMTADTLTINADDQSNVIHLRNNHQVDGFTTNTVHLVDVRGLDDANMGGDDQGGDNQGGNSQGGNGQGGNGQGNDNNDDSAPDEGTSRFPAITFANKTNVVINGLGGNDLFVLSVSKPATGLQNLTLDGGSGFNVLVGRELPPSVALTLKNIQRVDKDADAMFIDELFEERLERPADDSGMAFFKGVLNGPTGKQGVAQGIEESLEGRTIFVRHQYAFYLGRNAAHGEEQGWVQSLMGGESEEQVIAGIISSNEFYQRAQSLITSGTPDQRLIQAMYQVFANRTASSAEVAFWVAQLPLVGRAGVALGFVESLEFRNDVVTGYYGLLLNRNPDQGGLTSWVSSGRDLLHIREGIEGSAEFFDNG
jgi:hypothetical protein